MQKKRVFITGGTGFFGKNLLHHVSDLRHCDVVILSLDPQRLQKEYPQLLVDNDVELLCGDVRDFKYPKNNFDYILHAATTSCKVISDDEMNSVVVDGTRRVLEFASRNKNLANLLYISSGAVYGNQLVTPIEEGRPCDPISVYGKAKYQAEKLCLSSDVPCSIARCFAFVGEYLPLDVHFAIGNFILDCINERPIIIKGDGSAVRSYLYSGDLGRWLWQILRQGKNHGIYNVGSDREVSVAELAQIVKTEAKKDIEIIIQGSPSGLPPHRYVPDISLARKELGLEVYTSLEEAIRLTINFNLTRNIRGRG